MSKTEFDRIRNERGYDRVYTLDVAEQGNPEMHAHPFDALLLITTGEFTLKLETSEQQMRTDDVYLLPAGTLHAELCKFGAATATVAALKHTA